ncbi:hypothetical protein UFOVP715_5 [uncultured Caudovirales phage]|uniref:Uncharacterized protein n=1 Tax=uncultured Caudovirales phage TaxID=2100421 RepID=A0A6J5NPA5_9CAUD|nr:hypothetical protein UFOVP715_5 [uncultured Caudovirales phage]
MTTLFMATSTGLRELSEDETTAVLAERQALAEEEARIGYQRERAFEYPPITDYLDGVVKGDQAQVQAYIDACLAVKAKYPKPE